MLTYFNITVLKWEQKNMFYTHRTKNITSTAFCVSLNFMQFSDTQNAVLVMLNR
jgi:hypothetical protein